MDGVGDDIEFGIDVEAEMDVLRRNVLQQRIALHCATGRYRESVSCSERLVAALERRGEFKTAMEAKAWWSCTLMLIGGAEGDSTAANEGYSMYKEIVAVSEQRWRAAVGDGDGDGDGDRCGCSMDEAPYRWWTYFVVHFVRRNEWTEGHQLMVKMLEWDHDGRPFDVASTDRAFERFAAFLRAPGNAAMVRRHRTAVNEVMLKLHRRHCEVMEMLMDDLERGQWRRDGDGGGGDGEGESVEMAFSALNAERAPNMVAMLSAHILIFRDVGNRRKADEILYSAVTVGPHKRTRLNRQSAYFAKFGAASFGEKEERSLLNLCGDEPVR